MAFWKGSGMNKTWDVITVGEIYVDHVFSGFSDWPEPGCEVFAPSYKRELGGGAAITACALARLERRVAVFGVVGCEEFDWIVSRFETYQADCSALLQVEGSSGTTVSVSTQHDRSFFSYLGPNRLLAARLQSDEMGAWLSLARHVHFAFAAPRALALRILPLLREAGTSVSIDAGWNPAWYDKTGNRDTCREVDLFLPNEKEATRIARTKPQTTEPEELAAALKQRGFGNTVIKLGARGAIATFGASRCMAPPAVEAVDTTGAGDAFNAGLIDAWLDGASPEAMLQRGCLLGALSATYAGALQGLPGRREAEEKYGQFYQS
jgi:sugar/nucleoside kinase (ribokinase family)